MIDLHLHTTFSDGTWSLEELLENASNSNISTISITDHDTVEAHKVLRQMDYSKLYNGEIISGAEFNTVFNSYKFELLGYDFDIDKVNSWIEETYIKTKDLDLNREFNLLVERMP